MKTVIAYVDGMNLYHRIKGRKNFRKYLWLNLRGLISEFISSTESLTEIKYYTSKAKDDEGKEARQKAYILALRNEANIEPIWGNHARRRRVCFTCGEGWNTFEEKKSDTKLAVDVIADAFNGNMDVALILSGDSDVIPQIEYLQNHFPAIEVRLVYPPASKNKDLKKLVKDPPTINGYQLRTNQLPDEIPYRKAFISRPEEWRDQPTTPRYNHPIPKRFRRPIVIALRKVLKSLHAIDIKSEA